MEFLTYILHNSDRVFRLTIEHLELVGISIFAATVIGIPLGVCIGIQRGLGKSVFAVRHRRLGEIM